MIQLSHVRLKIMVLAESASKLINRRQRLNHESFAIGAIKKRLDILEDHYGGHFQIDYTDKNDLDGGGTIVKLQLPFSTDY